MVQLKQSIRALNHSLFQKRNMYKLLMFQPLTIRSSIKYDYKTRKLTPVTRKKAHDTFNLCMI